MDTFGLNGSHYEFAHPVSIPLAIDEGAILLTYDHLSEGWARCKVLENTGYMLKLVAMEGTLHTLCWYEPYNSIQDSDLYLLPG